LQTIKKIKLHDPDANDFAVVDEEAGHFLAFLAKSHDGGVT
jgi:hypothetical protein